MEKQEPARLLKFHEQSAEDGNSRNFDSTTRWIWYGHTELHSDHYPSYTEYQLSRQRPKKPRKFAGVPPELPHRVARPSRTIEGVEREYVEEGGNRNLVEK